MGLELPIGDIIIRSAAAATSSSASAASASAAPAEAAPHTPGSAAAAAALKLAYVCVNITWQSCIPWSRTYRHALPDFNGGHGVIA